MTDKDFSRLINAARARNASRDAVDKQNGLATPADVGTVALVAVARDALEASIRTGDRQCACEAYAFLVDALSTMKGD